MTDTVRHGAALFHLAQAAFILSRASITVALAGIRGGKTHAGAAKTLFYAIEHPCAEDEVHLVCSPTFPMSKVPVEKLWRLMHDKALFPISPLVKYIRSTRTFIIRCAAGGFARIQVVSLHDPDKIRGMKALSAWLDEGAYITAEAWDIVLGRVADTNGPVWITTTPAGYNFIHDLYERAIAEKRAGVPVDQREIRFLHWGSRQNPYIEQAGFDRLAANYDSRTHQQEVEALFVKLAGLVYYTFGKHNVVKLKIDRTKKVYIGQDFNVAAMASVITQQHDTALHVIGERLVPGDSYALVEWLDGWCHRNNVDKRNVAVYPDASGGARSTSGKSDTRIIRDGGYRVEYAKRNPFVKDRVNCVNGLLKPVTSGPRLLIDEDCTELRRTMAKQIWDTNDPPAPDKTQGFDHIADALGYVAWGRFPLQVSATIGTRTEITTRRAA